jgi:GDP-L-fucose synthase
MHRLQRDWTIYLAGHRGLVGSALRRRLESGGYSNLLTRTREQLDLTRQDTVERFFERERPQAVFLAAAKVGGIYANASYPADFIRENLLIQTHVIDAAHRAGVRKLVFLGSSCIYPKNAPQPIREEHLMSSPLEPTNECYSMAKIAGLTMVEAYRRQFGFPAISIMPCNLYGPEDNFSLESSHVIPALIRKFRAAVERGDTTVTIWGSGTPRREFMHVDDLADAAVFLAERYDGPMINVGTGEDIAISDLAQKIAAVVGYRGSLTYDPSKPDGTPRKLMDVSRLNELGWRPKISFDEGLASTYRWFLDHELELTAT